MRRLQPVRGAQRELLESMWEGRSLVWLDEISMVSRDLLSRFSRRLGVSVDNHDASFGGLGMVLSGDFLQHFPIPASTSLALDVARRAPSRAAAARGTSDTDPERTEQRDGRRIYRDEQGTVGECPGEANTYGNTR